MTVWRFATPDGARRASDLLQQVAVPGVHDAAIVEWGDGDRKPHARQVTDTPAAAALDGGFWGLLFGLVFFVPLLGAEIGATTGALTDALADVGIDDHFINRVRDQVTPGTSALFLLTSGPIVAQVSAAFADGPRADLIATDLDTDQEAALRAVFAD